MEMPDEIYYREDRHIYNGKEMTLHFAATKDDGRSTKYTRAPQWQTIESAPEATRVMLWIKGYGITTGMCTTVHGMQHWFCDRDRDPAYPTHWQHLPAPPEVG